MNADNVSTETLAARLFVTFNGKRGDAHVSGPAIVEVVIVDHSHYSSEYVVRTHTGEHLFGGFARHLSADYVLLGCGGFVVHEIETFPVIVNPLFEHGEYVVLVDGSTTGFADRESAEMYVESLTPEPIILGEPELIVGESYSLDELHAMFPDAIFVGEERVLPGVDPYDGVAYDEARRMWVDAYTGDGLDVDECDARGLDSSGRFAVPADAPRYSIGGAK